MKLETDVLESKCGIQNVTTYPRISDRIRGCKDAMLHTARSFCTVEKCHYSGDVNDKSMRERRCLRRNRVLGSEGAKRLHERPSESEEPTERFRTWKDRYHPFRLLQHWRSADSGDSAYLWPIQASVAQAQDCSGEREIGDT